MSIAVLIPCYNEGITIEKVINDLDDLCKNYVKKGRDNFEN